MNNDYLIEEKSDWYFSRAVDIDIVENEDLCFVYAKFSRFILIAEITGLNERTFQYSNLAFEDEFRADNQMINDPLILDFLSNRTENMKRFEDLSESQKEKNTIFYKNKLEGLRKTDYMQILSKYR